MATKFLLGFDRNFSSGCFNPGSYPRCKPEMKPKLKIWDVKRLLQTRLKILVEKVVDNPKKDINKISTGVDRLWREWRLWGPRVGVITQVGNLLM